MILSYVIPPSRAVKWTKIASRFYNKWKFLFQYVSFTVVSIHLPIHKRIKFGDVIFISCSASFGLCSIYAKIFIDMKSIIEFFVKPMYGCNFEVSCTPTSEHIWKYMSCNATLKESYQAKILYRGEWN